MKYKAYLEFEFESEESLTTLERLLQPALVETDDYNGGVLSVTLDNSRSDKFCIEDYIKCEVVPFCEECESETGYRMVDVDGTNLVERLVCLKDNNHYI